MAGTIIDKDLIYDSAEVPIPTSIPLGTKGRVSIYTSNDENTPQKLGMHWEVRNPQGKVVQEYDVWTSFLIAPNGKRAFEGASILFDVPGTWTIWARLLMEPGDTIVDVYQGTLCEVVGELEEFKGSIGAMALEADGYAVSVPGVIQAYGGLNYTARVTINGINNMDTTQRMGMHWIIWDPFDAKVQEYDLSLYQWFDAPPGAYIKFSGLGFPLTMFGEWRILVELLMDPASPIVVAQFDGRLVDVQRLTEPPGEERFSNLTVSYKKA